MTKLEKTDQGTVHFFVGRLVHQECDENVSCCSILLINSAIERYNGSALLSENRTEKAQASPKLAIKK